MKNYSFEDFSQEQWLDVVTFYLHSKTQNFKKVVPCMV